MASNHAAMSAASSPAPAPEGFAFTRVRRTFPARTPSAAKASSYKSLVGTTGSRALPKTYDPELSDDLIRTSTSGLLIGINPALPDAAADVPCRGPAGTRIP
jgi:hypothetical protein